MTGNVQLYLPVFVNHDLRMAGHIGVLGFGVKGGMSPTRYR